MDYHVKRAMLECYQRYTLKLTNIAELKDCFVDDMIFCRSSLILRQSYHFATGFSRFVVAAADGHSQHSVKILSEQ